MRRVRNGMAPRRCLWAQSPKCPLGAQPLNNELTSRANASIIASVSPRGGTGIRGRLRTCARKGVEVQILSGAPIRWWRGPGSILGLFSFDPVFLFFPAFAFLLDVAQPVTGGTVADQEE
jgi:hypothetical protein